MTRYAMRSGLERCPQEIIEEIVQRLELQDMLNLRLVGKVVSDKASSWTFRRLCHSKHVDLSDKSLRAFIITLQRSAVLPPMKQLYLVGLATSEKKPRHQNQADVKLLVQAFNEIAKRSPRKCLESLTLRVMVKDSGCTRLLPVEANDPLFECRHNTIANHVWLCAAETWHWMLRALSESELRIERIMAFNESDMQCCSIRCDQIGCGRIDNGRSLGLAEALKYLKSLSISVCDRVFETKGNVPEDPRRNYHAEAEEEKTSSASQTWSSNAHSLSI